MLPDFHKTRNVLLLYPQMPDTFWSMRYVNRLTGFKSSYPPLGLLTIAPLLPENWHKRLIDTNIEKLKSEALNWADIVFISAMNVQERAVHELVDICKEHHLPVVAGGPLFTQESEKFPLIDHIICNEAEITLPEFLADFQRGSAGRIYQTNTFADLSKTPLPEYDLIDLKKYNYSVVQFSRGCPYQCDFCDVTTLYGRVPRTKSSEQIITELNRIMPRFHSDFILFADDNLISNKYILKNDLLPALIQWRSQNYYAPIFASQVSINLADDDELIQLMQEAGFRYIFVGIETSQEESLRHCGKTQNLRRDLLSSIRKLHNNGFIVTGGFIIGFDTDTEAIFTEMPRFINDSGIVIATLNLLKAPPGTELYRRMEREGRLLEPLDFDENKTNFKTKMPKSALIKGYQNVLKKVYTPEYLYPRAYKFFADYQYSHVKYPSHRKSRFADIGTLFRLIFRVGLISNYRFQFWKLLFVQIKKSRKKYTLAFLVGALSFQFRKMYERFEKQCREDPYFNRAENYAIR